MLQIGGVVIRGIASKEQSFDNVRARNGNEKRGHMAYRLFRKFSGRANSISL